MTDQEYSWLDEVDTDRSTTGNYVLNGKDREFCITGEKVGSIKKSELRSRIKQDRVQELPQRFQDIFDDIALIEYSDVDFVSESEREELWDDITDIDTRKSTTLGFDLRSPVERGAEFQFGAEMGASIKSLRQTDTDDPVDLIWGFIIGLYGLPIESYDSEYKNIDQLLDDLHVMNDERHEDLELIQNHLDKDDKLMSNVKDRVERAFEENDIDPMHIPFSKSELWGEMFRLSDLGDDIYDKLDDVINVDQLNRSIKLKQTVEKDIEEIKQEEWRAQFAEDLIKDLWRLYKWNNDQRTQVENMPSALHSNTAMKLINQYSYPEKHKDQLKYTIIDNKSGRFRLNEYGKLVACCMFDERGADWILKYKIKIHDPHDLLGSEKLSDEKHDIIKNTLEEIDLDKL